MQKKKKTITKSWTFKFVLAAGLKLPHLFWNEIDSIVSRLQTH